MKNQNRFIIYARKSSEDKKRQVASISDQITECNEYALRESLDVIEVIEESKSAYKPNNRPQFTKMLQRISYGEADSILLWKPDRLSRNPQEGGIVHQMLLDGILKEIRTPQGDIFNSDSNTLSLHMYLGMANEYSRILSQNVKRGLKYKAERGEYIRHAPLGYEGYGRERQRLIRPHNIEGPLVRKLFQLASNGEYSLSQLVKTMFSAGLRSKNGRKLSKSYIHRILQNPMYYGYFEYADEMHEGKYEPLITKALFDQVQNALSNRSKPRKNDWNEQKYLNSLIKCNECGCSITTEIKKKHYKKTNRDAVYVYNKCTHKKEDCSQKPIKQTDMEDLLIEKISQLQISAEDWALALKLARAKHQNEIEQYSKMKRSLQRKLTFVEDKRSRLISLRMDGELTKDEFTFEKNRLMKEEANIKQQINSDEVSLADHWLERTEEFFRTAFESGEVIRNGKPKRKRSLIISVGQNLSYKNESIDVQFKKPYDGLLRKELRTNLQGGKESNPRHFFWRERPYHWTTAL